MPEFRDVEDLALWLQHSSLMEASIVSVRAALRALPAMAKDIDVGRKGRFRSNPDLSADILIAFRKLAVNWVLVKYPYRYPELDQYAKIANEVRFSNSTLNENSALQTSLRAIDLSLRAFVSGNPEEFELSIRTSDEAIRLANVDDSESISAVTADTNRMAEFFASNIADSPLWLRGNPTPLIRSWNILRSFLLAQQDDWQVWTDWYISRRDGRRVWRQSIEFARLTLDEEKFWKQGYQVVNSELQRIIELEKAKFRERVRSDSQAEAAVVLAQRPSSHSFSWKSKTIEALPVNEAPFDAVLAAAIANEIKEKAIMIVTALAGNHADPLVTSVIERTIEIISGSVDTIPEGILLMRANSIAAHAKSYVDASNDRERSIRALLDDFSASISNLVDCYPGIRKINANRLALDLQADSVSHVEAKLSEISKIAEDSPVVGSTARKALKVGQDELSEFSKKIDAEPDLDRSANFILAQSQAVAARLLDATNFVSATILKLSTELGELGEDTWKETKKVIPKSFARGISTGIQAGVQYGSETLLLLLATHIAGPWGGIALLVPRLAPHSKKINQILTTVKEDQDLAEE